MTRIGQRASRLSRVGQRASRLSRVGQRASRLSRVGQGASRLSRVGPWVLGLGIWLWLAALFLAPSMLMPVGALICHQRPERSFVLDGRQVPVCARCTGLYAGAAFAVPLALIAASSMASNRARTIALVASLPTAITWSLEFAGVAQFSNSMRFAAALPLGAAAAWLVLAVMAED